MPDEVVKDQFVLVVTDEAMERICYESSSGDSGWKLKPYQFAITDTDVLSGYSDDQIFNMDGSIKPEIITYLQSYTTEQMQQDILNNGWCQLPFSGVSKAGQGTLTHHIVIPPNVLRDQNQQKVIKTIYFLYVDNKGNAFLYGLARANTYRVYETGVTQSYFFNITVANSTTVDLVDFVVDYSYSMELQDHINDPNAHADLFDLFMRKDGGDGDDEHIKGKKVFEDECTFNKVIMGTAYRALSADIAEYYDADEKLLPGTLIQFGGKNEITASTTMVNGIVSTNPAYVLNANKNMEYPTLLTLSGRVPVRIKGKVNKFDLICISDEKGIGIVDNIGNHAIGRALESSDKDEVKLIECLVQVKI